VQAGCERILDAVRAGRAKQILNDNRRVVGTWHDETVLTWARDVWFPALWAAGVREFAWVQSPSVTSRASANQSLMELSRADVDRCMLFFDAGEATDWLRLRRKLGGSERHGG
jgi:hypothetical protein